MGPLVPLAALVWLALAPAPVCAQRTLDAQAAAAAYENGITKDLNPFTAYSFLRDQSTLDWLRSTDPEREARLVTQATQLKDLNDLLTTNRDASPLIDSLVSRFIDGAGGTDPPYFGFGQDTAKFLQWNAQWAILADDATLRKALMELDSLNPEAKKFLTTEKGVAPADWQKLSFANRRAALQPWAERVLDNINKANPKTKQDSDSLGKTGREIDGFLDPEKKRLMWQRIATARDSAKAFSQLDAMGDKLKDPGIQDMLAQARSSSDLNDTVTKLSQIFDKLGTPNKVLAAHRPSAPAEKFNDADKKLLASMLQTALMSQVVGTDAGDDLYAFYQNPNHKLVVTIGDMGTNLARYSSVSKDLMFNQKYLEDWTKSEGLKPHDLTTNAGELTKLAMLVSPVFVHEARHQEQDAWASEHKFKLMMGQNVEVEAMGTEAIFFIQKAKNPAFAKFFDDNRDSSILAGQEIGLADLLNNDGAPKFRNKIMSDYYEGTASLDGIAAVELRSADFLKAELARRKALPQADQDALEANGKTWNKDQQYKNFAEWSAFIVTMKTSLIQKGLDDDLKDRDHLIESYRAWGDRSDQFQADLDAALRKAGGPVQAKEPPPPSLDKK